MRLLSLLIAPMLITPPVVKESTCYLIEVNTFGRQERTQIIFRDSAGLIREWKWADSVAVQPARRKVFWADGQEKHYRVFSQQYIETRTTNDPEVDQRKILPENQRRGLFN